MCSQELKEALEDGVALCRKCINQSDASTRSTALFALQILCGPGLQYRGLTQAGVHCQQTSTTSEGNHREPDMMYQEQHVRGVPHRSRGGDLSK